MTSAPDPTREDLVFSFLHHLPGLSGLLRKLAGRSRMHLAVEVLGSGARVLVDLGADPVRVTTGGAGLKADVRLAATADDLHEVLLGRLGIMECFGQRRLLFAGGMSKLMLLFPILELVSPLYAEHIAASQPAGVPGPVRRALGRSFAPAFGVVAIVSGRWLRGRDPAAALFAITALARGATTWSKLARPPRLREAPPGDPGAAIAPRERPLERRVALRIVATLLHIGGAKASLLQDRLAVPVGLLALMKRLSIGIDPGPG